MTASLVSLFRTREGWTNEERAQFARIERLLEDAGFAVDVEHGLSDEGEPWCVFCSRATGDVVIHVACIDNRFMFDSTTLPRPIEGASFQRCAERFFEDVSLPMPLADRRNRVMLHPSAMLASLFITVLLYAQATTEQPLFGIDPVDVDVDDAAATAQPTPLALRIKAIAQQVAEYVNGPDTQAQQAYVNPGMASIPAGMALAVIAIAQDLAHAEAGGLIDPSEEPTIAAMLRAAAAAETAAPTPEQREAISDGAADAETTAAVAAAEEAAPVGAEADGEPSAAEIAAAVGAAFQAVADEVSQLADAAASTLAGAATAFGSIGDGSTLTLAEEPSGTEETAVALSFDDVPALSSMFAMMLEATGLDRPGEVAFALAGSIWEMEIVDLAAETLREIELAVFADGRPDTIELAVADEADGSVFSPRIGGSGWEPARHDPKAPTQMTEPGGGAGAAIGADVASGRVNEPSTPSRDAIAAILADDRMVSEDELDLLLRAFTAQVGDIGVSHGRDSVLFIDRSVTDHVMSRDLEATTVWLEDETRVTFVGTVWDFDGFAT